MKVWFACAMFAALPLATPAIAQSSAPPGLAALKVSGYGNITGTGSTDQPGGGGGTVSDAELEFTPQYRTSSGTVFAARAVANIGAVASAPQSDWRLSIPEASLFAIGDFGRIEVGERAGFPQSLVGFTPSEIAFASPGFGPESGARLDPDGGLPTSVLPPALGLRINALTYLGYAARFYSDQSLKAIYLTPRSRSGFYGAVSYTPETDRPRGFGIAGQARASNDKLTPSPNSGTYHDVVQAALVWNHRTETLDVSIGATYSHASEDSAIDHRSDSLSGGLTATFHDSWTAGLSGTVDSAIETAGKKVRPYGVVASADHVSGPWVFGGYYQHATANSRTVIPTRDTVDIGEIGLSYLVDPDHNLLGQNYHTDAKLFASAYVYGFRSDGGEPASRAHGQVLLIGARFSFF